MSSWVRYVCGQLDKAKAYPLLAEQYPEMVSQIDKAEPFSQTLYEGFHVILTKGFRFDAEDVLIFQVEFVNETDRPIYYIPQSLAVRVGSGVYWSALSDASGSQQGEGRFFVDWVLAKLDSEGNVTEFVAVEVQTIDTTGNYHAERNALMKQKIPSETSGAGLNWENVSKRILPQLIFKGNVLQREILCKKGLYFICLTAVHDRIMKRLGGNPEKIHPQPGAITFRCYDLLPATSAGETRALKKGGDFTTTIQSVALALIAPTNLPAQGSYLAAIDAAL